MQLKAQHGAPQQSGARPQSGTAQQQVGPQQPGAGSQQRTASQQGVPQQSWAGPQQGTVSQQGTPQQGTAPQQGAPQQPGTRPQAGGTGDTSRSSQRAGSTADRVTQTQGQNGANADASFEANRNQGEQSSVRAQSSADRVINGANGTAPQTQDSTLQRTPHRYRRTSAGGDMAIDEMFDLLKEHSDLDYSAFGQDIVDTSRMTGEQKAAQEARNEVIRRASSFADAVGQLSAGDNREKVAGVVDDLLQGTKMVDDNLMAERFEGMTADEYEARAKANTKKAIQEALSFTGTTVGGATLGTAGGFMNIGMSSKDSMLEEFGAGFIGGAAIAGVSSELAFDGMGERTIKVYNPYDGSYTDVKIKKDGTFFDGQIAPLSLQEGEIVDLTDPRLAKVRTQAARVLVDAAAQNRKKKADAAAVKKANKFEDALNSRNVGGKK